MSIYGREVLAAARTMINDLARTYTDLSILSRSAYIGNTYSIISTSHRCTHRAQIPKTGLPCNIIRVLAHRTTERGPFEQTKEPENSDLLWAAEPRLWYTYAVPPRRYARTSFGDHSRIIFNHDFLNLLSVTIRCVYTR